MCYCLSCAILKHIERGEADLKEKNSQDYSTEPGEEYEMDFESSLAKMEAQIGTKLQEEEQHSNSHHREEEDAVKLDETAGGDVLLESSSEDFNSLINSEKGKQKVFF